MKKEMEVVRRGAQGVERKRDQGKEEEEGDAEGAAER